MNFEQIKGIFSSALGTVSNKSREYAGVAVDTAKSAGRIAKLNFELAGEKESLKKAYAELGKACYESKQNGGECVCDQLFDEVNAIKARIAEMEAELAELKKSMSTPQEADVEVSFEEVVEADEKAAEEHVEASEQPEVSCCCEEKTEEPKCCCEEKPEEPKCCCEEKTEE